MVNYSIGARLAWEISSYEAANKSAQYIEADHIMLGILSLDKIQNNFSPKTQIEIDQFIYEKELLYNTLNSLNINITLVRRKLRNSLPNGERLPANYVFHRSEECKKMFTNAAFLSNNIISINRLFLSILKMDNSQVRILLKSEKVDIERLETELLFTIIQKN
jgi:ATP-dependent Clp protease ATP-binding subunit ClpC